MNFLNSLTPQGYLVLAFFLVVIISFYSYLWKNFRTVAWIVLIAFCGAVFYYGFAQNRSLSDVIITVPGIGKQH